MTGAPAMERRRAVPKGKASGERSPSVRGARMARASGPMRARAAMRGDVGEAGVGALGICRAIQAKSWVAKPVPVTM